MRNVLVLLFILIASPAGADVYMFNGAGSVWSNGLGTICDKINAAGVRCHRGGGDPLNDPSPIVLIGHSMGGAHAINIALVKTKPRVSALILLDPVGSVDDKMPVRVISIHSPAWGNRIKKAAVVILCKLCVHTTIDDAEWVQKIIIREALAAYTVR